MQESSRALITNKEGKLLLILQNYLRHPEWFGDQWYTVGGNHDAEDASPEAALVREIREELGEEIAAHLKIQRVVDRLEIGDRFHHFFHVEYDGVDMNVPRDTEELLEGRFFSLAEVEALGSEGRLLMGCEVQFFREILSSVPINRPLTPVR